MMTDGDRQARKVREQRARAVFIAKTTAHGDFVGRGMTEPPHGWENSLDAVDSRLSDIGAAMGELNDALA